MMRGRVLGLWYKMDVGGMWCIVKRVYIGHISRMFIKLSFRDLFACRLRRNPENG